MQLSRMQKSLKLSEKSSREPNSVNFLNMMMSRQIFDLYMKAYTQDEIADQLDKPRKTVSDMIQTLADFANLQKSPKLLATFQIWKKHIDYFALERSSWYNSNTFLNQI